MQFICNILKALQVSNKYLGQFNQSGEGKIAIPPKVKLF